MSQARRSSHSKQSKPGPGCLIGAGLLLLVFIVAIIAVGWGVSNLFTAGPTTAELPGLEDETSPEAVQARREEALARLNSYGWIDEETGQVRLPIEQAMAIIAERGLPVRQEGLETPTPEPPPPTETPLPQVEAEATPAQATPIAAEATPTETPSPTPTEEVATETATFTPEPPPPTATPLPQVEEETTPTEATPIAAEATPTETPSPTPTEEATPTETPSATPTEEAATETPTPTPTPEPSPTIPPTPTVDLANVSFQQHVLPIFVEHCNECHGEEEPEEGLRLTGFEEVMAGSWNGSVIEPGNVEDSYLIEQVVTGRMPKRGPSVPEDQIDIITAWVEAGAPDN